MVTKVKNFIGGDFDLPSASDYLDVINPATYQTIAEVPLTPSEEVDRAAKVGYEAYKEWRQVPVMDRVQPLFKLKGIIEENMDEIAKLITNEAGKTYKESLGEIKRAIENIEVACGMPSLIMGRNIEDIARGIDEHMIRQPLGVVAAITPFNFPFMIPLWFMPYAVAAGNTFILKPSEKVPTSTEKLFEYIAQAGFPEGVIQLVNGGKDTVNAILDHPRIRAISFVGSTPVAQYIYSRATANGKRAQCQGGAKNPVVIMPDADMEMTTRIMADSAFGCAGQRCLAASVAITVGSAKPEFTERIVDAAVSRKVGYGLDSGVQMGAIIDKGSVGRIHDILNKGEQEENLNILVDGRNKVADGYTDGAWVFPTILADVNPAGDIAHTEIFGPVLSLMHAKDLDEAIAMVNGRAFGNMGCIFTTSGPVARKFRYEVDAGNIGVNIGVAAPMAQFPFSGWNDSFFGDLHAQGAHAVEFYTQTKIVVERWPREWSREF